LKDVICVGDRYFWVKIAGTYVGAVIGAGFASGQENVQFFGVHGSQGVLGAAITGILFMILGVFFLQLASSLKTNCYGDFLKALLGSGLASVFDFLVTIFLFFGLVIMLAGSGAVAKEYLGVSSSLGIIGSAVIILIAMNIGIKAVFFISLLCVPILVLAGIWASVSQLISAGTIRVVGNISREINFIPGNWAASTLLYVSYNMLLALSFFCTVGKEICDKCTIYWGGIVGGGVLGGLLLLFQMVVRQIGSYIESVQIPMLYIAFRLGQGFYTFYAICLWMAILTTGVANGYSLLRRIVPDKNSSFFLASSGIIGIALPLAYIGFANLIRIVYPLFGYVGLILIILVIGGEIRRQIHRSLI
jgi:uncharacterized membrane protein YkvI